MTTLHDFEVKTIDGKTQSLADYRGKVCLVVNVASECGYTNHYEGLEALYRELKGKEFAVLGFPCNDFGGQEPGTEAEIAAFCTKNYNVTFPMFGKISILAAPREPLYEWLTHEATNPDGPGDVPDPYWGKEEDFQEVFEILDRSVEQFLARLLTRQS